jgi:hypothetical protein
VAANVTTVSLDPGNANEVASVPVSVNVLLAVRVLPSAIVSVDPVAGAVNATLLILVAVATPRTGVTSVGLVDKTTATEPVEAVTPVPPWATGIVVNPDPILPAVNAPTPVIPVYDPDI